MLYTSFGFNILLKINPNLVMYFVVSLFENLTDYLCLGCCFDCLSNCSEFGISLYYRLDGSNNIRVFFLWHM
jgi:hypothetical protein